MCISFTELNKMCYKLSKAQNAVKSSIFVGVLD